LTRETQLPPDQPSAIELVGLAHTEFLVVDDSEDTVEMLAQLLKIQGANVTTVTNGIDALGLVKDKHFDVILSDISMPGMDGFEFLRRLRQIPGRTDVPVVEITGFGRKEDIQRAHRAGFFSHLTKPLSFEGLAHILNQLSEQLLSKAPAELSK